MQGPFVVGYVEEKQQGYVPHGVPEMTCVIEKFPKQGNSWDKVNAKIDEGVDTKSAI